MNQQTLNFTPSLEDRLALIVSKLRPVDAKIAEVQTQLETLREERKAILKQTPIQCPVCSAISEIGDMVYIQTHWYVAPRSCTAGDYWNEGEGKVDCPSCNSRLRLYNRPDLMDLKHLFKNIEKTYDKN